MYCLSLAVAGDLLFNFGYASRETLFFRKEYAAKLLGAWYAKWFALNLGFVWLFTLASLIFVEPDQQLDSWWTKSRSMAHLSQLISSKQMVFLAKLNWLRSAVWNSIVAGLMVLNGAARRR